ncbi:hypothetical protein [uncultured Dysosmobacter sp.]|uniref:hypothetical protein n=1 Tax=uncultured Dysosmobacter sp. TaxID=2591384 RepID=UPI00262D91D1|nr:hypothetical protein [uncultured Dysosmobacter sp.]
MIREIGSEFWNVPTAEQGCKLFPETTQWFLSGRSALQAIIKDIRHETEVHTVAMPSWCCDSMIVPFLKEEIDVHFYPVYWKNGLIQEIKLDCDVLFLMDYFGYTPSSLDLPAYSGVIIRDVTHSIFSSAYMDADYYFGSLRKWCGIWTGGYAWAEDGHRLAMEDSDDLGYTFLREQAMKLKNSFINGFMDNKGRRVTDKGYLKIFDTAEDCLEKVGIAPAAERDVLLAKRLDVETIKARRRENAEILRKAFHEMIIFPELKDSDCPMFVPVLVPDGKRDILRRYLTQHDIYCPVHWTVSAYHRLCERELNIYQNELSLVCDQRYTEEDMYRMIDTIEQFLKGGMNDA